MTTTLKMRKGPYVSATKQLIGTKKKGNDGNMWKVVENKNGIKRWLKISTNKTNKTRKDKTITNKNFKIINDERLRIMCIAALKKLRYSMSKSIRSNDNNG